MPETTHNTFPLSEKVEGFDFIRKELNCMIKLIQYKKKIFLTHRNSECHGGCQGLRAEGNGKILVKGYRLPVIRAIRTYSNKQLGDYS